MSIVKKKGLRSSIAAVGVAVAATFALVGAPASAESTPAVAEASTERIAPGNGDGCQTPKEYEWKRIRKAQKQVLGWEYVNGTWVQSPGWHAVPDSLQPPHYGDVAATGTLPSGAYGLPVGGVQYQYQVFEPEIIWSANKPDGDGWQKTGNFRGGESIPCDNDETKKVTLCHATGSESNPYEKITVSVAAFLNAGHISHPGDIYEAFSYVKNGQTHNVAANGDTSLLQYPDCQRPKPEKPTFPPDVVEEFGDCATGDTVVTGTRTTTNFVAVFNAGTWSWDKVQDGEPIVEQISRALTDEEQAACMPSKDPTVVRKDIGEPECGDTTIEVEVTTTTYTYVYDAETKAWTESSATEVTYETRNLTEEEQFPCDEPFGEGSGVPVCANGTFTGVDVTLSWSGLPANAWLDLAISNGQAEGGYYDIGPSGDDGSGSANFTISAERLNQITDGFDDELYFTFGGVGFDTPLDEFSVIIDCDEPPATTSTTTPGPTTTVPGPTTTTEPKPVCPEGTDKAGTPLDKLTDANGDGMINASDCDEPEAPTTTGVPPTTAPPCVPHDANGDGTVDAGEGCTLPATGSSTGTTLGLAFAALITGLGLFFVSRRRTA